MLKKMLIYNNNSIIVFRYVCRRALFEKIKGHLKTAIYIPKKGEAISKSDTNKLVEPIKNTVEAFLGKIK